MTLRIAGAGLAGLLAAHAWPQATVFEASPAPRAAHRAVLRFRSDAVAQLTGIEFRPVTVRKGIWLDGGFVPPSIRAANMYSRKVLHGRLASERSIWNLEPAKRYIAPETLYEQLVATVGKRIEWNTPCVYNEEGGPVVSTAPLPAVLESIGAKFDLAFDRQPIHVERYRVPKSDVFQTVYFPWPDLPVYRASITGDLLIVESMGPLEEWHRQTVDEAFALGSRDFIDRGEQRFGKIVALDDTTRRSLLHWLTSRYKVYSLGRFATWRNVLLDDVVHDIAVIRKLLRSSDYEQRLHFNKST